MESRKAVTWLVAGLLLLPAIAAAGTVIETRGTEGQGLSVIYINDDNARVENTASPAGAIVFHRSADEVMFIDHRTHRYQRVGREQLRQFAERVARTREQLRQRLQQMPKDQRERLRGRMEQMLLDAQPPKIRIETGDHGTTAGIRCREAVVRLDDEPSYSVCVASADSLGLSQSGLQTMRKMFAFFGEMTAGLSEGEGALDPRSTSRVITELNGIPIRSETIGGGSSWAVTSVQNVSIAPEKFRVPDDYVEVDPLQGSR